jgi:stage IV sporulation protein FB
MWGVSLDDDLCRSRQASIPWRIFVFINLQRTPYDLNWRMFGIPVRVHPSFWFLALLFNISAYHIGIEYLLIGMAGLFIIILIHELGHALMYRAFRSYSSILLYAFGGLTFGEFVLRRPSWRIIVSLAGPLANFLLAAVVWASDYFLEWARPMGYPRFIFYLLFWYNIFLGLLNLLPVYPLDGGQISRELWVRANPFRGIVNSLKMSIVVAAAIAAYAFACEFNLVPRDLLIWWLRPTAYVGVLFIVLAIENYSELQRMGHSNRTPWDRY